MCEVYYERSKWVWGKWKSARNNNNMLWDCCCLAWPHFLSTATKLRWMYNFVKEIESAIFFFVSPEVTWPWRVQNYQCRCVLKRYKWEVTSFNDSDQISYRYNTHAFIYIQGQNNSNEPCTFLFGQIGPFWSVLKLPSKS